MKFLRPLFLLLVLACTNAAWASGFEFCDFNGVIASVEDRPADTYEIIVNVSKASRAKTFGDVSYTNCSEYKGKAIEVEFGVTEIPRRPVVGDSISFSRSVVDVFNETGGYSGTSVKTTFCGLQGSTSTRPVR